MGNTASSNGYSQINKTDFTFTYQLVKRVQDPHYGPIKIVRDIKTGEEYILKEIVLTVKGDYQEELDFYNRRITVAHPNVVRIYGCSGEDENKFCSNFYRVSVFIEMLSRTLADELDSRLAMASPFNENEILFIAESLISGLSYFEAQGISHGDIRPDNIFTCNDALKLSDPNLSHQRNSNGLSMAILGNTKVLLSPQLLSQVPKSDFVFHCNRFKADVFSLGVTLLSLASFSHSQDFYDYKNGKMHLSILEERLELVRKSYSKFTFELIRDMVRISEEARPDFISLSNRLLPYQEEIRSKSELPFYGIRARHIERIEEEDELDISRYTYQEKENPILKDFINDQIFQTSNKIRNLKEQDRYSPKLNNFSHQNTFGLERTESLKYQPAQDQERKLMSFALPNNAVEINFNAETIQPKIQQERTLYYSPNIIDALSSRKTESYPHSKH